MLTIARTDMRIQIPLLIAVATLAAACAAADRGTLTAAEPAAASAPPHAELRTDPIGPRTLIRQADIRLDVENVAGAAARARTIVEASGGHVVRSSATESRATLAVRVPAERLDEALEELGALGRVTHRRESTRDVTEAVLDLDARLQNQRAVRDRLRTHLERAESVAEVIQVERELVRVQSEIDSLEARLEHLRSSAAMSEVGIQFDRQRVLGPLGLLFSGAGWVVKRLFVIR